MSVLSVDVIVSSPGITVVMVSSTGVHEETGGISVVLVTHRVEVVTVVVVVGSPVIVIGTWVGISSVLVVKMSVRVEVGSVWQEGSDIVGYRPREN